MMIIHNVKYADFMIMKKVSHTEAVSWSFALGIDIPRAGSEKER